MKKSGVIPKNGTLKNKLVSITSDMIRYYFTSENITFVIIEMCTDFTAKNHIIKCTVKQVNSSFLKGGPSFIEMHNARRQQRNWRP